MSEKRFVKVTPFAVNDTWDNHRPMECASSLDADVVCHYLNEQQATIEQLRQSQDVKEFSALFNQSIALKREIKDLKEENEQLRKQCFELEKDYLIETSDISDKIYLGDEIKELKQRYGVDDE